MEKTKKHPDSFLSHCFIIMQIFGTWPLDTKHHKKFRVLLHKVYMMFVMFSVLTFNICLIAGILIERDLQKQSDSFSLLFLVFVIFGKSITIILQKKKLENIISVLQENTSIMVQDKEIEKTVSSKTRHIKKVTNYYCLYFITSISAWLAQAYVNVFHMSTTTSLTVNNTDVSSHIIMNGYYPFDVSDPFYRKLAFSHQVIGGIYNTMSCGSMDVFYFYLMFFFHTQFIILAGMLGSINPTELTTNKTAKMNITVVDCVKFHQIILKCSDELNSLISLSVFLQFISVSLTICFAGLKLVVIPTSSIKFISMVIYLLCIVFQLGLLCWYANEVTVEGLKVQDAVYKCEWQKGDKDFKYVVQMMIMMAQKPVVFTAGKFGALSLRMFIKLLQSSYSYFAVLRQMHQEENEYLPE